MPRVFAASTTAVELGDDDRRLAQLADRLERRGKLRPAVERVGNLAALVLDVPSHPWPDPEKRRRSASPRRG